MSIEPENKADNSLVAKKIDNAKFESFRTHDVNANHQDLPRSLC
jgi:hypothetical protein